MALSRLKRTIEKLIAEQADEDLQAVNVSTPKRLFMHSDRPAPSGQRWQAQKRIFMGKNALTLFIQETHLGEHAYDVITRISQHNATCTDLLCGTTFVGTGDINQPLSFPTGSTDPIGESIFAQPGEKVSKNDLLSLNKYLQKHAVDDDDILPHTHSAVMHCDILQQRSESVYDLMQSRCVEGAKSFTQSFIETFGDKYLKPWLINQGVHHENAATMIQGLKNASLVALTHSLYRVLVSTIVKSALETVLTNAGFDKDAVAGLATKVATVMAITDDPFNLIELGVNGMGAQAGEFAAWELIYKLPKLKKEPAVAADNQQDTPNEQDVPDGLRLQYV